MAPDAATSRQPGSTQPGSTQPGPTQPGSTQPGALDDLIAMVPQAQRPAFAKALRGRVADLGAGAGSALDAESAVAAGALAQRVIEVDRRRLPGATPASQRICADLRETLPLRDGHFDLVVCNHVLEHLPEPAALAAEAARIVRPQGFLIAAVPHGNAFSDRLFRAYYRAFHRDPATFDGHVQRFTKPAFVGLIEDAGFDVLGVVDVGEAYAWLHKHPLLQRTLTRLNGLLRRWHNDAFLYGWLLVAQHRPR
ncbi:MAG: methyltransferase domain-containing protein [Planctomycetota bacterium]